MNRRPLQAILVFILAAAFLAPPLSQVLCSDSCVGGACEAPETSAICDIDATGGCCGEAEPVGESAVCVPGVQQFTDQCRPCPCYVQAQIGDFIVSERTGKLDWTPEQASSTKPLPVSVLASDPQFTNCPSFNHAHGPPLYQRYHALLI